MSDATNSNKRDLWLYDDGSWREGFHDDGKVSPLLHFIARPAADDDAREERLKAAEAAARVCREDAEANATRAERAEARCRQIAQRIIDRIGAVGPENAEEALDRLFRCDHTNAITLKRTDEARCAATARAERAEAATREADARANTARIAAELMRAKAERAEAERDELRARLDAARGGAS